MGDMMKMADDHTLVIVASGLSQEPYLEKEEEGGMHYYRLKDHKAFASALGLTNVSVFPLMSRDWQVGSSDAVSLESARRRLESLKIEGESLFKVAANIKNHIFLETAVTRDLSAASQITNDDGTPLMPFHEAFVAIAIKTGHHCGSGLLWLSEQSAPAGRAALLAKMPLAKLYDLNLKALGVAQRLN